MSNNIDYVYSPEHDFYIPRLTPPESPKIGKYDPPLKLSLISFCHSLQILDCSPTAITLTHTCSKFCLNVDDALRSVLIPHSSAFLGLMNFLPFNDSADDYYDEIEICAEAAEGHFKSAHQIRNRSMVDRSDLVVFCVEHSSGGAYQTMQYAKKVNANIVNFKEG